MGIDQNESALEVAREKNIYTENVSVDGYFEKYSKKPGLDFITLWDQDQADLEDVVDLINAWDSSPYC